MIRSAKTISDVTNGEILAFKKKPKGRMRKLFLWLVFIGAAGSAFLYHPHIQTIEPLYLKAGLSLLGILIWPTWLVAAPVWDQVQIGTRPLYEDTFLYIFYGGSVLLPALIWAIRWYWLSLPASPKRADDYRIERHRKEMGRLNPKEALAEYSLKNGAGFPLVSLSADIQKRHLKLIGLKELKAHSSIIAPTGGGKGMHLTELIFSTPYAMVIIDPKGEQLARTGGYRSRIGPIYTLPGNGIDLSCYYDFENRDDIAELHYHMLTPWKDNQPVFADKTKALFSAVGLFAKKHNLNPFLVLLSLAESDPATALKALATVAPGMVYAFTNGKEPDEMDRMAGSSWGTFSTRLYSYWVHASTITNSGPFSIPEDWVEQKATIYITYSFDQLKGAGGVISAVLAGLMRQRIKTDAKTPMIVAIDELIAVGLGNVDTYLATVRSYGISLVLYIQDYAQLVQNYGDRADTILANSANKVWYRPNEMQTAEKIERIYGTKLKPSYTHSRTLQKERMEVDMGKKQRSISQNLQIVPALEEGAIKALGQDEVICEIDGNKVLRGYRLWPVPRLEEMGRLPRPTRIIGSRLTQPIDWPRFLPEPEAPAEKSPQSEPVRKKNYSG